MLFGMPASENPGQSKPDLPWYISWFRGEKATIMGAPIAFIGCVIIATALFGIGLYWFIDHLYSAEIRGKDAASQRDIATIRNITEERDAANRENAKLRNENADYLNVPSSVFMPQVTAPPGTYTNGMSILRATVANGWPEDGQLITFHQSDGIWFQINNQSEGNESAFRTGRSTGWGAWQYPANASGPFNPAGNTYKPENLTPPDYYPQGISLYRAEGAKGWPMDGQVFTVRQTDGVWLQWNNSYTGDGVFYRSGSKSGWFTWQRPVVSDAGGNVVNSGNFTVSQNLIALGGAASLASNTLPVTTISVGGSPFGWTNNTPRNVFVFVSGKTTSVAINGTTVFAPASDATIPLQTNEWITVIFTHAPEMKWKPF
jgi:hypothetical protein